MKQALFNFWHSLGQLPNLRQELQVRYVLMFTVLMLLCLGTTMIASASMPYAEHTFNNPLYFITRQLVYLSAGMTLAWVVSFIPMRFWFAQTTALWLFVLLLLGAVLLLGASINGSKRWIALAGVTFQPSELAKFVMVLFTADYVVRRADEIRFSLTGFWRLCVPMGFVLCLTMLEPDLGATVVIAASMLTVFFLAGAQARQFGVLAVICLGALAAAIIAAPYRLTRATSFLNPWDDEYGTDYQLKQSLIAFGRGEWTGAGLGHSVQKLSYLPEAHTDFMLAVIGEELGFVGISVLFALLLSLVCCAMHIGHRALKNRHLREGYLAYGISTIFLLQIMVNGGMNMGMLPTKGLTLPFISYGGTSLVVCLLMVSVLLRVEKETRQPAPKSAHNAYYGR